MKYVLFLSLTCIMSVLLCHADVREYDPIRDSNVEIVNQPRREEWTGSYMWYPGQLAAFLQQQCVHESRGRCINVGYPGKFFAKCPNVYFKREICLKKETALKWYGHSGINLYINGEKQITKNNRMILLPGKQQLIFEAVSSDSLPCIILQGENLDNPNEWQASMDKQFWTIPESDMRHVPSVRPDDNQEITAIINPNKILPLRNSETIGTNGIQIGQQGCALIDFFYQEVGYLTFSAKGSGTVTVRVGETPEEALEHDEKKFEQYPLKSVELSDKSRLIRISRRALRYVSLECDKGAVISDIKFEASMWPVDYQMQFDSDDDYINNLFKMSCATLHSSMHGFYLDGIKRDFLPWSMDALISTLGGDYLFGDKQVSANGISIALMPLHPKMTDLGIPDYPLHALFGLKQNYLRYGDLSVSLRYKDRIKELLDFYTSIADKDGFVHGNYGDDHFGYTPGWSTQNGPARKGVASYAQIMLYYNYKAGAYFARLWKDTKLSEKYDRLASQLKKRIMEKFWDKERKAFKNGTLNNGETDDRISHHAQYWAILADLFPTDCYANLFDNILPNLPYYYTAVSYEKGYEFLAYAKAGRVKDLWSYIDRVWGDWMKQGYSRFPENFLPGTSRAKQLEFYHRPYGLSLCHGANGVPVVVGILNGLIGFSSSDQKNGEYVIKPNLLHLKWIKTRVPVKEGFIDIELHADGSGIIQIPEHCIVNYISNSRHQSIIFHKAGRYTLR